jgi:hypothetical protein
MTPEQMGKMPPSAIAKLDRDQLASITPAQVKKKSLKQIRAFNDEFCDSVRLGQPARCYGSDVRDYLSDQVRVIVESRLYNGR